MEGQGGGQGDSCVSLSSGRARPGKCCSAAALEQAEWVSVRVGLDSDGSAQLGSTRKQTTETQRKHWAGRQASWQAAPVPKPEPSRVVKSAGVASQDEDGDSVLFAARETPHCLCFPQRPPRKPCRILRIVFIF